MISLVGATEITDVRPDRMDQGTNVIKRQAPNENELGLKRNTRHLVCLTAETFLRRAY